MIVRERPHWLLMLFVWRGSVLFKIVPQLLLTVALSTLVVIFHPWLASRGVTLTPVPFSIVGVALAIFLGFRNNASYERYWEARKLWGSFLNDGRSFARQALAFSRVDARPLVYGVVAFVHGVRHQLRHTDPEGDFRRLLPVGVAADLQGRRFPASRVLAWVGLQLRTQLEAKQLEPILAAEMDRSLSRLNDSLGGCERIAQNPLPFTYSVILHRTVYIYCFLLPFGLQDSIGFMTPVMVGFAAYCFFSIEALGDELEEPFGTASNDLPLTALSVHVEASLLELLGDRNLPEPVQPVDFLLI